MNPCSSEVLELQSNDVMTSKTTSTFQVNTSPLVRCQSSLNYFNEFCLYPPSEDNLSTMCADPAGYDPLYLFGQMVSQQLTTTTQMPVIISYRNRFVNSDWVNQPDITPIVGTNIVLNEVLTGNQEWFIGTTTVAIASLPNPLPVNQPLVISQHSLSRAIILPQSGSNPIVQFANVYHMIVSDPDRVVCLFDCGNICVYQNEAAYENKQSPIWESFTNDKYNSTTNCNRMQLPLQPLTNDSLGSVSSPNGLYLLIVYSNHINLIFNAFNNPRFTYWTATQSNLSLAIDAQSNYCFQALNTNSPSRNLVFADNRCTCTVSDRMVWRIYDQATFDTLSNFTKGLLTSTTPCLMRACQLDPAEYSNVARFVGTRCQSSNSLCATSVPADIEHFLITQDCVNGPSQCTTSSDCPFGAGCREGQCLAQCTTDFTCAAANPFATCVNGQCQIPRDTSQQTKPSFAWILAIVFAITFVIFLCLCVYYGIMKNNL